MQHRKEQVEKFAVYAFIAGVVVMLLGFGVWAVTGRPQPAVKIIITPFWLVFAGFNMEIFYTGRLEFRNIRTIIREQSPALFYLFAIPSAVVSMGIATVLLLAAYFTQ